MEYFSHRIFWRCMFPRLNVSYKIFFNDIFFRQNMVSSEYGSEAILSNEYIPRFYVQTNYSPSWFHVGFKSYSRSKVTKLPIRKYFAFYWLCDKKTKIKVLEVNIFTIIKNGFLKLSTVIIVSNFFLKKLFSFPL